MLKMDTMAEVKSAFLHMKTLTFLNMMFSYLNDVQTM